MPTRGRLSIDRNRTRMWWMFIVFATAVTADLVFCRGGATLALLFDKWAEMQSIPSRLGGCRTHTI